MPCGEDFPEGSTGRAGLEWKVLELHHEHIRGNILENDIFILVQKIEGRYCADIVCQAVPYA